MQPIPNYGDHITLSDFIEAVEGGCFIDYDGHGHYATATEMSDIVILPSDVKGADKVRDEFTHVVWFNK